MAATPSLPQAAQSPPQLLAALFDAAVQAASPARCLGRHLGEPPRRGRVVVVGAGKAAAAMAAAVEAHWPAQPLSGLVVTRYGHGAPCHRIEVVEAGHPVPDAAGEQAAQRIQALVSGLGADDLVLCLISGGGSSLLSAPAPGISLEDKRAVNRALLRSGASIGEMNCVRKHLSALKGGRLALACHPARVLTLVISDVPGDDPSVVASGPTLPDASTAAEALAVLQRYGIDVPPAVLAHLRDPENETPKPGDPRLARNEVRVIATAAQSLDAAAAAARSMGIAAHVLCDDLEGEAREVAKAHAALARQVARHDRPFPRPCLLLSGGETTVTVRGRGRGGRNAEYLLGLALALQGEPRVWALAADTDGIDGSEDNAGAWCGPDFLQRCAELGLQPLAAQADNDAWSVFSACGQLLVTGPTRTNVNDFRALLVY
ncbi:glycerate kinase type-2 family protein [Eleftheria terrae]|uniref:glycerate kinase type-2 family protein n=1 Tax=Eleftheria terrae TaxID=1597781 RepID=UPI00263AB07C|nr:glycerate kinase [Eleftheria terrae]WKB55024.1 glycerate kinase [Eleftheria terrae]